MSPRIGYKQTLQLHRPERQVALTSSESNGNGKKKSSSEPRRKVELVRPAATLGPVVKKRAAQDDSAALGFRD